MKVLKHIILFLALGTGLILSSCDGDDPQPQPTTTVLSLTSATLDGNAITPNPSYTLTLDFDAEGVPTGYSASGSAPYQPTVGSSGTFSVSGSQVTFTSGSDSRTVAITGGSIDAESTTVTLEWTLEKIDVAAPADAGTYSYVMAVQ